MRVVIIQPAIYIDDVMLVDPLYMHGNLAYSGVNNFSPFVDNKAVRGQETEYATLSNLIESSYTLSNGSLSYSGNVVQGLVASTIFATSGKYYCEYQ